MYVRISNFNMIFDGKRGLKNASSVWTKRDRNVERWSFEASPSCKYVMFEKCMFTFLLFSSLNVAMFMLFEEM